MSHPSEHEELFDENFAYDLLQIFEDPAFCSHLKRVSLVRDSFTYNNNMVMEYLSNHCRNLRSIGLGLGDIDVASILQVAATCGKNLEEFQCEE